MTEEEDTNIYLTFCINSEETFCCGVYRREEDAVANIRLEKSLECSEEDEYYIEEHPLW